MKGCLEILSVGRGDLKLQFNKHSNTEVERAKTMIDDMLKRGYAIVVELEDGSYQRISGFDPEKACYIISEMPAASDARPEAEPGQCWCGRPEKHRGAHKGKRRELPIRSTRATAIARSAGG